MKDAIRVLLVDPISESRLALREALGGMSEVTLAEACDAYETAAERAAAVAPELVVVDVDHDPEGAVILIQALVRADPMRVVLPASRHLDSAIILRVIRAGAREFLTLPPRPDEIRETIGRLFDRRDPARQSALRGPRVIAVAGAAGGVGCTTVAVNVAASLAKNPGHEAVIVDLDLMLGSVDAYLDVVTENTMQGLAQSLDRLDLTLLKRSLFRHPSGLYVLPHPTSMAEAVKIDTDTLRRMTALLTAAFPSVVLDTSKGLQGTDFLAYELADVIFVVLLLDVTCVRNTSRLLELFRHFDGLSEKVRLVANRTGSRDNEISVKRAEETLNLPIAHQIPNDTKLFQTARAKGASIDSVAPGSRLHEAFLGIVRPLHPHPTAEVPRKKKGFFAALF